MCETRTAKRTVRARGLQYVSFSDGRLHKSVAGLPSHSTPLRHGTGELHAADRLREIAGE